MGKSYWASYISDKGTCRSNNQDAILLKTARTPDGEVILAAIADGVGGLSQGELASGTIIHDFADWFDNILPTLNATSRMESIKAEIIMQLEHTNKKLINYSQVNKIKLGTTLALFFSYRKQYFILNIGDTRVYSFQQKKVVLMSKDHTYVQNEVDHGRMSMEEAIKSSRRNVLIQCVGITYPLQPECKIGNWEDEQLVLICSDGFCNQLSMQELERSFHILEKCSYNCFQNLPRELVEVVRKRGEKDNISAIYIMNTKSRESIG